MGHDDILINTHNMMLNEIMLALRKLRRSDDLETNLNERFESNSPPRCNKSSSFSFALIDNSLVF